MEAKINALKQIGTWEFLNLLPGKQPVGYKCIYKN